MWTLEVYYETGNSFGSERCKERLGLSWKDLNKAKQALSDIEQHYKAYKKANADNFRSPKEFFQEKSIQDAPWFTEPNYWQYGLLLEKDDGTRQQVSAFWCGYFEDLYHVEIVGEDPYMKVTFN